MNVNDFLFFLMTKNIQERVAALSVEEDQRQIYTGMDNLLFEKAYTHMIDIVKKFPGTLPDGGTEEITTEETVNPKELFTTKKVNLMAMIAFLNGCYAAASEEKSEIPDIDVSQIIYQGDLITSRAPVITAQLGMRSADPEMQASTSNNLVAKAASKKSIPELLQLISVADEEALLALSDNEFNSRVKNINSIKIRGKIRDIRTDYLFQLKKQQEKEEAARKMAEREAQLDRFYATMQIKKIYKHPDGSILGCEITDPEGLL